MRFFLWILIALSLSFAAGLYWKSRGENQGQAAETINASKETVMTNTLIGHWTLDGNNVVWGDSATEIKDSTVNANHGNALGALARSSVVPGMAGQGVSFDGSTDYMHFGSASSLDDIELQGGGGMTISVWVKRERDNVYETLIGKGYLYGGWYLTLTNNDQLRFRRYYDTTGINCFSDTNYGTNYGNWMHIVFTWTGSSDMPGGVEFYKDGVVVSKVSCSQDGVGNKPSDGTRSLVAGIYESDLSSEPFLGDMDDIRIYNSVLTATQVADLYRATSAKEVSNANHRESLTNGLVGYWTFDGRDTKWSDTSTEIKDISGSGNHGNALGSLATTSVTPGKLGQGLSFNGTGDYVDIPSSTIFDFSGNFSVSAWVSVNSGEGGSVVGRGPATLVQFWRIEVNNYDDCNFQIVNLTSSFRAFGCSGVKPRAWTHLVATLQGASMTLWTNGVAGTPTTLSGGLPVLLGEAGAIGDITNGAAQYFSGKVDDVRVYSRALSSVEIVGLYNTGK